VIGRGAESACRAVGLAKAEGALHSAYQLERVSTPKGHRK
jgi:hypothetical protein